MIEFSTLLDRLASDGAAEIQESRKEIRISHLENQTARTIAKEIDQSEWREVTIEDAAESSSSLQALLDDFGSLLAPLTIVLGKKEEVGESIAIVTLVGLRQWLSLEGVDRVCRSPYVSHGFTTYATSYISWMGESEIPESAPHEFGNPRQTVRSIGSGQAVTGTIASWLLRPSSSEDGQSEAFVLWRSVAVNKLLPTLAIEAFGDAGRLVFGSYGRTVVDWQHRDEDGAFYDQVSALVEWVYGDSRAVNTKHAFASDEIARQLPKDPTIGLVLETVESALDAARRGYAFYLQEISRDALSALSDLRKLVTDEISKIGALTRQLSNAVATALAVGVSLVAARIAFGSHPLLVTALMLVVVVYVSVVARLGTDQIKISDQARVAWWNHIYKFVGASDYERLVDVPSRLAARSYKRVKVMGTLAVAAMFLLVLALSAPKSVYGQIANISGEALDWLRGLL